MSEEVGLYLECIFSKRFQERKKEREARKKRIADGEEEVPMSVVEFLDAVEEPLKDLHIPQVGQKKKMGKKKHPTGQRPFHLHQPSGNSRRSLHGRECAGKSKYFASLFHKVLTCCPTRWQSTWSRRTSGLEKPEVSAEFSPQTQIGSPS